MSYPKSRNKNVIVQEVSNDTLVYDLVTNKAVCLNETSASIWKLCNGTNTVREISEKMTSKLKESISEEYVWLALNQLKKENLIEENDDITDKYLGLSRRDVIRKVGFGSMIALPLITSIVAPRAIAAQSVNPQNNLPLGAACLGNSNCASNFCTVPGDNMGTCCLPGSTALGQVVGTFCESDFLRAEAACCAGGAIPSPSTPCTGGLTGFECDPF